MRWKVGTIVGLCLAVAGVGWGMAQTRSAQGSLSAQDYVEIQMLYNQYAWALDSNAENGMALAKCFTPDGVFQIPGRDIAGREAIAKFSTETFTNSNGTIRHWFANVVIRPAPEGAAGAVYVLVGTLGGGEKGAPKITSTAMYRHDVIVRTAEGWRFKTRRAEFPA